MADPAPRHDTRRAGVGIVLILAAAASWGVLGIFGTYAQRAGLSPYDVAWWRAACGSILFGAHALTSRARFPRGRDLLVTVMFGVVSCGVFYASYQVAVAAGGASLASVLLYTAPAFVAVLGVVVLRERLSALEVAAVAGAIAGVALVALGGGQGVRVSPLSVGAGLTAGFTYALYYVYGRSFYSRYGPSACLSVAMLTGAVVLLPVTSPEVVSAAPRSWPALAGIVVISTYVAFVCHAAALQRLHATRASVFATLEPVIAAVLASMLLHERPTPAALAGGLVVVLAAVALAVVPGLRARRAAGILNG